MLVWEIDTGESTNKWYPTLPWSGPAVHVTVKVAFPATVGVPEIVAAPLPTPGAIARPAGRAPELMVHVHATAGVGVAVRLTE
jgi:hypothetical protein